MVQPEVRQEAVVAGKNGMHLRPIQCLSELAKSFASSIQIVKEDNVFDGKSVFDLLSLNAIKGTSLLVIARGADAADAAKAISAVIEKDWDESPKDDKENT